MNRRVHAALITTLAYMVSCSPTAPSRVTAGTWGGDHVRLDVTAVGATLEYDCAHGTIDEPLAPDRGGRFSATGTHVFEHGGPIRVDETPNRHPARYDGQVSGDTLQLTVTIVDTQQGLGVFTLRLAALSRLTKCL
jgi:hypothetical protein